MVEEIKAAGVSGDDKDIEEGKIFAVLAYIGILCLVPLLLKKENKFALHHGKQGLVIFIGEVAAAILTVIPILGIMISILATLIFGFMSIIGIIQALCGNYWKAPVIADFAGKINI